MAREYKLIALATALSLAPYAAYACMCPPPPPAKAAAKRSDRVFVGKVISIHTHKTSDFVMWVEDRIAEIGKFIGSDWRRNYSQDFYKEVTLQVIENFKGASANQLVITTGWGGGDCGAPFDVGQSYLVFARQLKDPDELVTGMCDGTGEAQRLKLQIAQLRVGI